MWTLCMLLRKYAASIQSALKINRRVNKQDGERESVHVLLGERGGGCRVKENVLSLLFSCLQRENRTLWLLGELPAVWITARTQHTQPGAGVQFWRSSGPGRKLVLWGSRIWRSLETSLLNSTPADRRTYVEEWAESKSEQSRSLKSSIMLNAQIWLCALTATPWITATTSLTGWIFFKQTGLLQHQC